MDSKYATTRKIMYSLNDYLQDLLVRLDTANDPEDQSKFIRRLQSSHVEPFLRHINRYERLRRLRRHAADVELIRSMPSSRIMQNAAWDAMVDLQHVLNMCALYDGVLPTRHRNAVNVMCCASIFFTTEHGRPGDWQRLKKADVVEMKINGFDFVVVTDKLTSAVCRHCAKLVNSPKYHNVEFANSTQFALA